MTDTQSQLKVAQANNHETDIAQIPKIFESARAAQEQFAALSMTERIGLLKQLRYAIVDQQAEISSVIALATGKAPTEALTTEVMVVADALLHVEIRAPKALATQRIKTPITFLGKSSYVEYKPRGVVVVISPWNFPFMLAMVPVVEALAAGNAVIVKPSEETPEVGHMIEKLITKIAFPANTLQVVHGGRQLGDALVKAKPDFVHFTGSVNTGKAIASFTGPELIPTTLELGGKDPMIIFEDANIDRSVNGAIWGAFSNAGQVCMSVERLYVQKPIFDIFIDKLVDQTSKLKLGNGPSSDVGSMTTSRQVEIVKRHVKDAISGGAKLICGAHPDDWDQSSRLISPMILVDVKQNMDIIQEETFGPVLPVMAFETEDEAISLANDSHYGLNSSVWTRDLAKGKRVISKLTTGGALLNDVILTIGNPYLPYGGAKDSGVGSYHSDSGIQNFAVQTAVMVDRGKKLRALNWFPYADKNQTFEDLLQSYWGARKDFAKFGLSYLKLLNKSKKAN